MYMCHIEEKPNARLSICSVKYVSFCVIELFLNPLAAYPANMATLWETCMVRKRLRTRDMTSQAEQAPVIKWFFRVFRVLVAL